MRLIDADALKNLPFERMIHTDFGETAIPIEEIDNAPTVEYPFYQEAYQTGYEEGHIDGVLQGEKLYARPQGEWIPCYVNFTDGSKPLFAYCKCSLCNKQATGVYKFCPNCGAEMVGGES